MMRYRLGLLLIVAAGCDGVALESVSGRVTLDGNPLPNAIVVFEPVKGKPNPGMGSIGKTDQDGRFTLRQIQTDRLGAALGDHRVKITTAHPPTLRDDAPPKEPVPAIYNVKTTLKRTVPSGGLQNEPFDLFSTPKERPSSAP